MPACLYCGRTDPPGGFTREHVLQSAFGGFRNALTLTDAVCGTCNQYFGDHLDVMLARDSIEAVLRLLHGLKDPAEIRGMLKHHVRVRLPRDGTMWGGAHVELTAAPPGQEGLGGRPMPQVGFERRDGTGWDYLTEDELRAAGDLAPRFETDYQPGVKNVVGSDEEAARLLALMRDHGVPLKGETLHRGISREGPGEVNVSWIIDEVLARAAAKIAVNYLAWAQGAEFARRPEFEDVRRFVRYGAGGAPTFVRLQSGPVVENRLGGDPPACHLIVLFWSPGMRPPMLCRLTLFNRHAYLVRLCTAFYGPLWREVKSGHTYDLIRGECREHHRTPIMPPEGWAF
jgi:HNH endonuclease